MQRWKKFLRDGAHCTLDEVRGYMQARVRGEDPVPPRPRKLPPDELAAFRARG